MQAILLLAHWFVYHTFLVFQGNLGPAGTQTLRVVLFLLAFSFTVAALVSFSFFNPLVTLIYKIAAIWLGFLNFFFLAACACWVVWFVLLVLGLHPDPAQTRPLIADVLFCMAFLTGIYGLVNALWIRVRRITVHLANLPESWRGRTALMVSDIHLGHVNGIRFVRRIVALAARLAPDIVFIPGDIFDGTKADAVRLATAFKELSPPFGIYFSTGNHEEYGDEAGFLRALRGAGVRVLVNEMVKVEGLQIVGVPYRDSTYPMRLRATLEAVRLDPGQASILLNHVPNRLPIVEQAGIGLQLSGHTHGGQIFPSTWFTRRIFGKFTNGLHWFGGLQVYTSTGAGTWGPPMRVGTHPEVVLLRFE